MESLFCPYELAVKLKELGFDEPCLDRYDPRFGKLSSDMETWTQEYYPETLMIPAPLFQQAFRWFRERHELYYTIEGSIKEGFQYFVYTYEYEIKSEELFNTYEEAEPACLEKLIEIVEQQKQK